VCVIAKQSEKDSSINKMVIFSSSLHYIKKDSCNAICCLSREGVGDGQGSVLSGIAAGRSRDHQAGLVTGQGLGSCASHSTFTASSSVGTG